jgi:hypothetical protein
MGKLFLAAFASCMFSGVSQRFDKGNFNDWCFIPPDRPDPPEFELPLKPPLYKFPAVFGYDFTNIVYNSTDLTEDFAVVPQQFGGGKPLCKTNIKGLASILDNIGGFSIPPTYRKEIDFVFLGAGPFAMFDKVPFGDEYVTGTLEISFYEIGNHDPLTCENVVLRDTWDTWVHYMVFDMKFDFYSDANDPIIMRSVPDSVTFVFPKFTNLESLIDGSRFGHVFHVDAGWEGIALHLPECTNSYSTSWDGRLAVSSGVTVGGDDYLPAQVINAVTALAKNRDETERTRSNYLDWHDDSWGEWAKAYIYTQENDGEDAVIITHSFNCENVGAKPQCYGQLNLRSWGDDGTGNDTLFRNSSSLCDDADGEFRVSIDNNNMKSDTVTLIGGSFSEKVTFAQEITHTKFNVKDLPSAIFLSDDLINDIRIIEYVLAFDESDTSDTGCYIPPGQVTVKEFATGFKCLGHCLGETVGGDKPSAKLLELLCTPNSYSYSYS